MMRTLAILGRVSNLPTVWSNCLAAWLLAGGSSWPRLALVSAGATFLYTGGMFLNDAFDVEFDRRYRPERPIPSGATSLALVWTVALACLLTGWLFCLALGKTPCLWSSALVAAIVVYDYIHKRTPLAPLLMSACRWLLYLAAGSAAEGGVNRAVVLWAGLLAAYVTGLSYFARRESRGGVLSYWPALLLFAPAVAGLSCNSSRLAVLVIGLGQAAWVAVCVRGKTGADKPAAGPNVAGLLAGIVLLDWLAAGGGSLPLAATFCGLFLLALFLQRNVPAT